jgi:hypothetical protein
MARSGRRPEPGGLAPASAGPSPRQGSGTLTGSAAGSSIGSISMMRLGDPILLIGRSIPGRVVGGLADGRRVVL